MTVGSNPDSFSVDSAGNQMPVFRATLTYLDPSNLCYPDGASGVAVQCEGTSDWYYTARTNPLYGLGPQPVTGNLADLPITSDMLSAPLPNNLTAQLADRLWQQAASMPGYDGAPYQATSPVASADVATATTAPTWGDLVEGTPKAPADSGVTVAPDFYPVPSGGTGGTPSSSQCDPNSQLAGCVPLGSVPASGAVPTSDASISLTPWNIGSVDGTCPAAQTVSILGTDFQLTFDPLCAVVQKLRPLVLALCALAAAFIVAMGVSL
ncbi:virulence factor TspB C-terminal domain-related protein [Burkholderia thailandensis]|nr:virulence factor TspB C-terminal domain-related protein [Burkholderia thailandensis]